MPWAGELLSHPLRVREPFSVHVHVHVPVPPPPLVTSRSATDMHGRLNPPQHQRGTIRPLTRAADLRSLIRDVPDFPVPGVLFRDITPLLLDPGGLATVVDHFATRFAAAGVDRVAAIESRGFIFGAPLALRLGCGFVPVRKVGKLPWRTVSRAYSLEYGSNHLEVHEDAILAGQRILVIDDVLATGGTAAATIELVGHLGGEVVGVGFLLEIAALGGRHRLGDVPVDTILTY